MSGEPEFFNVARLEVLHPGQPSGSPKNAAVQLGAGGDPFDALVTVEVDTTTPNWWGLAEAISSNNPGLLPSLRTKVQFKSLGLGPGFEVDGPDTTLAVGGTHPAPNQSIYQVRVPIDPDALFVDGGGNPAPDNYLVGCNVDWDLPNTLNWFATGTYDGPGVIFRVALNVAP